MLKDKLILLIELCVLFGLFLIILYEIPFCIKSFVDFWTLVGKAIHHQSSIPGVLLGLRSGFNSNPAGSWGPTDRQARCW